MAATKFRTSLATWIAASLLVAAVILSAFGLVPDALSYLFFGFSLWGIVYYSAISVRKQASRSRRMLVVLLVCFCVCLASYSLLRIVSFPENTFDLRMFVLLAGMICGLIGVAVEYADNFKQTRDFQTRLNEDSQNALRIAQTERRRFILPAVVMFVFALALALIGYLVQKKF